ncbi:ATP-binding cassette domain-containing protein [Lacisediminihabitans profunda]|uniref:ATP-binding cassette domain-containing protein n=1 Tax=Lacisediminihabitans profunda TaxID=2594790 RepID=A0A5C8UYD3_9MICO|nr:ATP-binding cassette domain-containing protein [Lacisediminihabitans profunda]TXN32648.1 ATP-binding cassette domain-containing protein [Lacisediminihabitans profunda]
MKNVSELAQADGPAEQSEQHNGEVLLRLTDIVKSFPGVRALSDVTLEVRAGEVHALVGENGAGKSTLMAVASGALEPDAGTVEIGGTLLTAASPDEARSLGLGIVRQDPALLLDLTVAENMAIGVGYTRAGGLRAAPAWAQSKLDPWEMGISARARVSELSVEQRFVVEIAKALALKPRVLLLDEPTEHLSIEEVQRLFRRVRELVKDSAAVVYISHRIPEVLQIADRITVLRDGQTRGTYFANEVTETDIIERVVGRALDTVFPPKGSVAGTVREEERLSVAGLTGHQFADVSFSVRAGEIVGLAGVQGNGQTELIRALAGIESASGSISIAGSSVRLSSNTAAARAGVVYVPSDRHAEGVFLPLTVGENVVMKKLRSVSRGGVISEKNITKIADEQIHSLGIKTPSSRTAVGSLSGGNQQKVVLARTMLSNPKVLLAEEPTQGVDAGARIDIYKILRSIADSGAAVVLLSSDGVELEGLCDRVLIMSRGSVIAELEGADVTEAEVTRTALTSTSVRKREPFKATTATRLHGWMRGDQSPAAVLGLLVAALAIVIGVSNPAYFSAFSLNNLLFIAAPLIFIGIAQQVVVMGSGFDLSVGPLMGFLVVTASFFIIDGGNLVLGLAILVVAALAVGFVNGFLVTRFNLSPVVVTLAMALALQGTFLTLRNTPGGAVSTQLSAVVFTNVGFVPVATIVAVIIALLVEFALRRTRWGVELRAVGSRKDAAERLGINSKRAHLLSYILTSLLVVPASVLQFAQIGIGDGRPGLSFTLSSVTVVVLAGASIFGGRGSFIGVLAAALLVAQVLGVPAFLGLSGAWGYWLPGLITICAAVLYAQIRRIRRNS